MQQTAADRGLMDDGLAAAKALAKAAAASDLGKQGAAMAAIAGTAVTGNIALVRANC